MYFGRLIEKMLDKALKLFLMLSLGGSIQTVSAVLSICRRRKRKREGEDGWRREGSLTTKK